MVFNPHLPIWQIKMNIFSFHSIKEARVVVFPPTILFPSLICNGMINDLKPLHIIWVGLLSNLPLKSLTFL